jgi:hypothetical protein
MNEMITPSCLAIRQNKKEKSILSIIRNLKITEQHCKLHRRSYKIHLKKCYFMKYVDVKIYDKMEPVMTGIIKIIYICEKCGEIKRLNDDEYYCNVCIM